MRYTLLILYFAFMASTLQSQNGKANGKLYLLKGKIVNKMSMPPHCGTASLGTVLDLEIISFSDHSYTDKNMSVVLTSTGSFKDDYFETGKTYDLKISDENKSSLGWTMGGEKSSPNCQSKSTRWLVSIKKID